MSRPQFVEVTYRREPRWIRRLQAIWRDTKALWNEFRTSIVIFLVVTIIGGQIYGVLHNRSGLEPPIAPIDRPYVIMQLMVLSPPPDYEATPDEWYLIIFWYALPPILALIVGSGVSDFARLFFDRSKRYDAWREALASTYRHHIIVFGAGHVGLRIMRVLNDTLNADVVAIDYAPRHEAEKFLQDRRIPLIRGDGTELDTLQKAGVTHADAFIACTGDDHTNLEAIMRVRSMNRSLRIVARMWDNQFADQLRDYLKVQAVLSSSDISAPVFAGVALGIETTQSLEIRGESFSTIRLTINEGSFLNGQTVGNLQEQNDIDVVLHAPNGLPAEVQPSKHAKLRAGDELVVFGLTERVLKMAARNKYGS